MERKCTPVVSDAYIEEKLAALQANCYYEAAKQEEDMISQFTTMITKDFLENCIVHAISKGKTSIRIIDVKYQSGVNYDNVDQSLRKHVNELLIDTKYNYRKIYHPFFFTVDIDWTTWQDFIARPIFWFLFIFLICLIYYLLSFV